VTSSCRQPSFPCRHGQQKKGGDSLRHYRTCRGSYLRTHWTTSTPASRHGHRGRRRSSAGGSGPRNPPESLRHKAENWHTTYLYFVQKGRRHLSSASLDRRHRRARLWIGPACGVAPSATVKGRWGERIRESPSV
jgi:hypothetical protein